MQTYVHVYACSSEFKRHMFRYVCRPDRNVHEYVCGPAQDTHLHALLQRLLEQLEVDEAYHQRQRRPDRIPKLTKQAVIDVVQQVWMQLDHQAIVAAGYRQTGPTLPLLGDDGGLSPDLDSVFKDLRPFVRRLNLETVLKAAFKEVDEAWADGIVTSWSDASTLVEQHTGHKCMVEGTEGIRWEVEDGGAAPAEAEGGGMDPERAEGAGVDQEEFEGEDAPNDADDVAGADDTKVVPHITYVEHLIAPNTTPPPPPHPTYVRTYA